MLPRYHPQAVFWGTGARVPFQSRDDIEAYFARQFGAYPHRHVRFELAVVRVDHTTASASGLYTFEVATATGDKQEATHRYSFTFINDGDAWNIFHPHSSQMP